MKYKSIFYIIADPLRNIGGFRDYLIDNSAYLITFHFFLGYSSKPPYMEIFENGKLKKRIEFSFYSGNNAKLRYVFYYLYIQYIILFFAKRGSYIFVANPIFCFLNSFSSIIKNTKLIFWIGDYFPDNRFPMSIYHFFVDYYNRHLKYVLYVSPPLEKLYMAKLDKQSLKGKVRRMIPIGIKPELTRDHKLPKSKIHIGFIGIIREMQGIELLFSYIKGTKNCHLDIVGDGYRLPFYKSLAKKLSIQRKITFYGPVDDVSSIFKKWNIGFALYKDTPDNLSKYCEPTKIKNYLGFGLPVITTKTTYFHTYIHTYNAGEIVEENIESIADAVEKIRRNYVTYRKGVETLVKKYSYSSFYDKEFTFMRG